MKPERLARTEVYRSPWVNLYLDRVRFPNGHIIEHHHLLDFEHPAVGVYIENSQGNVLMVQVCRYTTGLTEWEIPAGGVETGEDLPQAARREALEETGYSISDPVPVYSFFPLDGIANHTFHIFRCRAETPQGDSDPHEISAVGWFSPAELQRMIAAQELHDSFTLVALLLCLPKETRGTNANDHS